MDIKALADSLSQILAPALPRLVHHDVEDSSNGTRQGGVDRASALWRRLRTAIEERPAAADAVQEVAGAPGDPDAQAALRLQLRRLLEANPVLAGEVASLLNGANPGAGVIVQGSGNVVAGAGGIAIGNTSFFGDFSVPRARSGG